MNKLYYILFLVFFISLASCDDDDPVTVHMQYGESETTVETVSPEKGYINEQFALTGKEFGGAIELVNVFIGDFQANIISCSNQKIVAEVPKEAITGKIFLELLGKKMATDLTFSVLDYPMLVTDELSGYKNSDVTFTGTNMPVNKSLLTVKFGDLQVDITSYEVDESGNGTLKVKVPAKLEMGTVKLTIDLLGEEIYNENYRILPSPTVDARENWLSREGQTIRITGTGFGDFANKIKVSFGETEVIPNPADVSDTKITAQVPVGFTGGKVSIIFEGFPASEIGDLQILNVGNITGSVLKNSVQPFQQIDALNGGWATPSDWEFNDAFGGDYALHFPSTSTSGLLAIQTGWGRPNKVNAKIYQEVTLPAGIYKFTLSIAECGSNSGEFGVMFTVAKGRAAIPDLTKQGSVWTLTDASNVLGSYRISDRKEVHEETVEAVLTEETEVTIGLVSQITGQGWVKLSSIGVTLE